MTSARSIAVVLSLLCACQKRASLGAPGTGDSVPDSSSADAPSSPGSDGAAPTGGADGAGGTGGGALGSGGSAATDAGSPDSPLGGDPMALLDGQQWLMACRVTSELLNTLCDTVSVIGNCPGQNAPRPTPSDPFSGQGMIARDDTVVVAGDAAVVYDVTIRVRGVVQAETYTGGVQDQQGFYIGGALGHLGRSAVFMMGISSPQQVYYLNALVKTADVAADSYHSFPVDFTATIPIAGGASVRFVAAASSCEIARNCDTTSMVAIQGGTCNPTLLSDFNEPGINQPYNGEFLVMHVLSAVAR
jgi:hypothetical protein